LVRRRHGVGDDRELGERMRAEIVRERHEHDRRHDDVCGETAVDVVARHRLVRAGERPAMVAEVASAARHHRRYEHLLAHGHVGGSSDVFDDPGDFVPEDQRQLVPGPNGPGPEADVRVTQSAAGDADPCLPILERLEPHLAEFQRVRSGEKQTVGRRAHDLLRED
jgi:hypothetical protein